MGARPVQQDSRAGPEQPQGLVRAAALRPPRGWTTLEAGAQAPTPTHGLWAVSRCRRESAPPTHLLKQAFDLCLTRGPSRKPLASAPRVQDAETGGHSCVHRWAVRPASVPESHRPGLGEAGVPGAQPWAGCRGREEVSPQQPSARGRECPSLTWEPSGWGLPAPPSKVPWGGWSSGTFSSMWVSLAWGRAACSHGLPPGGTPVGSAVSRGGGLHPVTTGLAEASALWLPGPGFCLMVMGIGGGPAREGAQP